MGFSFLLQFFYQFRIDVFNFLFCELKFKLQNDICFYIKQQTSSEFINIKHLTPKRASHNECSKQMGTYNK